MESELLAEWTGYAYAIAEEFFLAGGDRDDIRQESLIGLLNAIRGYNAELGSFKSFVILCVRRHLYTVVKTADRGKHRPLNDSIRDRRDENDNLVSVLELLPDLNSDPADRFALIESLRGIRAAYLTLTPLERTSLQLATAGIQYKGAKSIDNAIQRARNKLKAAA